MPSPSFLLVLKSLDSPGPTPKAGDRRALEFGEAESRVARESGGQVQPQPGTHQGFIRGPLSPLACSRPRVPQGTLVAWPGPSFLTRRFTAPSSRIKNKKQLPGPSGHLGFWCWV